MNSLKGLLKTQSRLQTSLDSLLQHQKDGSIPKDLRRTDNSLQLHATSVVLRERVKSARAAFEKCMFQAAQEDQEQELAKVTLAIHDIKDKTVKAYIGYIIQGQDIDVGLNVSSVKEDNKKLLGNFLSILESTLLKTTRLHKIQAIEEKTKQRLIQKKLEEKVEERTNDPEPTIRDLVTTEVKKALSSPKPAKPGNKNDKNQPKAEKQNQPKNGKRGNPHDKGSGSGSQRHTKKKSKNGQTSQSSKSRQE